MLSCYKMCIKLTRCGVHATLWKSTIIVCYMWFQSLADTFFNENPDLGQVEVDELHCKTGNKVFNLHLRDKRQCTSWCHWPVTFLSEAVSHQRVLPQLLFHLVKSLVTVGGQHECHYSLWLDITRTVDVELVSVQIT